ncbi:MAG TPA: hypothetical protein VIV11_26990 [Kofleriaceae bacterium]
MRVLVRIIALLVLSRVAYAQPGEQIVVVISADAAFTSALDDALSPGGMDVISLGALATPSSTELTGRSRELADQQRANATVWLMPALAGATLVAYDRTVDRLLVRELPYGLPLAAPQAAEAARMIRTMLRALRLTNDSDVTPPPPIVPAGPPPPWLAASVGIGAWFAAPGNDSALAASFAIAYRPHGLGVALTGVLSPAADLMNVTFEGQVRDIVLGAEARKALQFAPDVYVTPAAGMTLHVIRLTGAYSGGEIASNRFDPALRVGVTAGYALPRGLDVGLTVSADCLLRRQKYVLASEEILVVPRLQIVTGLFVGLRL